mgnify:CR=1 FL=1
MRVYRGDSSDNWQIDPYASSRYGFPVLFFASNIELARLYSDFLGKSNGSIYELELTRVDKVIDFGGSDSYSGKFRNTIYDLFEKGIKSAVFENVYDRPSSRYSFQEISDVYVVFDFTLLKNQVKI